MTMSFLLHDSQGDIESAELSTPARVIRRKNGISPRSGVTIIREKLQPPSVDGILSRTRLLDLLDRSIEQYGATLISGRSGTGKTTLAADFASRTRRSSWYAIEPADSDWREFSAAFMTSLLGRRQANADSKNAAPNETAISKYLTKCFTSLARDGLRKPRLIVLDNVHHLFDTVWFAEFFRQLVVSLDENARLLILCRSKPSAPLWRLRSKQMLNVIDEDLLDLTETEAKQICRSNGGSDDLAIDILKRSYGRVSTFLKELSSEAKISRK